MPDYKSHSVHGDIVLPKINSKVKIDRDDFRNFSLGPDILVGSDPFLFDYQHRAKVRDFFKYLIKYIKQNKLYDNSMVMTFLYGYLDHLVTDIYIHPLIDYMSADMKKEYMINPHSLLEMKIDNYVLNKYNEHDSHYYKKTEIVDDKLESTIEDVYTKVFNRKNMFSRYNTGIKYVSAFDQLRYSKSNIIRDISSLMRIGDFYFRDDYSDIIEYLNNEHDIITNPTSNESSNYSFDDLWDKTIDVSLQTIDDVNKYFYLNKEFHNYFIDNDISYDTGVPCDKGKNLKYVRKYNK